tara:strand:- start:791 stop:2104 length:1314 start_codon:yes stop_codon:yes gene_type:complete
MGELRMTELVFHHDWHQLPIANDSLIPVQLYGIDGKHSRSDIGVIGNPIIDKIQRLGVQISNKAIDFLSIALAVTAADTFVLRSESADGWTRQLSLTIPLCEPENWIHLKEDLERALHFLSGDMWSVNLTGGGYEPPIPHGKRFKLVKLDGLDCVSLFSGGLDSAIGVIDLLSDGNKPLLVSHAYKGDKSHQEDINQILSGEYSRFEVNAYPLSANGETDITMRTRSINFLAFAVVGASALQQSNSLQNVDLYVPENGFISLNAPLTPRRIGTLSTRTTHPHFIKSIQSIFDQVGIECTIINPYQFKTKGQMVLECQDRTLLANLVNKTVSCSHWKRKNQQCGTCVPCIIRKASLHTGGIQENITYFKTLTNALSDPDHRDDVMAMLIAVAQKERKNISTWVLNSGPLPENELADYKTVFTQGLNEVKLYFESEGIL